MHCLVVETPLRCCGEIPVNRRFLQRDPHERDWDALRDRVVARVIATGYSNPLLLLSAG